MRNLTLFLPIFFIFTHHLSSQTFNFKNYNVNDDLPQAYIYTINQSPKGKLWVGTGEGLSTFDGDKFTNYTVSEGLSENFIISSLVDSKGLHWFGHYEGGITVFNGTDFSVINTKSLIHSPVNVMLEDAEGNVWAGTQNDGLFKISKDFNVTSFKGELSTVSINSLCFLSNRFLLAGTNAGLLFLELGDKASTVKKKLLSDINTTHIIKDNFLQRYWISTSDEGIYLYYPEKDSLSQLKSDVDFKGKTINLIYKDNNHHLWVSLYGSGISKFTVMGDSVVQIGIYNTTTGLSNNYVKSFFIDRENNTWIGTYGGGLDQLIDPVFTLYTTNDNLPSNDVTAIFTQNNLLWIGSKEGIVKLTFSPLQQNNLEEEKVIITKNLPTSPIKSINYVDDSNLLLGTNTDGVWCYNYLTGKTYRWHYYPHDPLANKINQIARDQQGFIWIATENGAYQYHAKTKKADVFNMEKGLLHNNIHSIYIDKNNTVWFGTHGTGLSGYKNGKIITFKSPQEGAGIDVDCFEEDETGNLWIGTYGQGIYIFNGNTFIRRITQKNGLGSNYCYSIIRDGKNNMWVGHKNGISKYDPVKREFFFHQKKHGFLAEEINANASCKDLNGNLWFGTTSGLLRYNPSADKPIVVGPLVNLYDIRLFFQKVNWKKYTDTLFSLYKLPAQLVLPYNQNHLTFGVKGISLSDPEKVKYKYKLDGFERDWSLETNENFVTYANMPPGKYVFMAIAKNSKGIWSSQPTTFHFEILNPFWKTWWFILIAVSTCIMLFIIVVKTRTKSLIKRQVQLQEEKDRLLAEISEREKAQRLQKITEEKLRQTNQELNTFIYRASHDLRGPLSTVKGLTNLGIMEIKDEGSLRYFNLISDRIMRLDTILKDLIHIVEITEIELDVQLINFQESLEKVMNELVESNTSKAFSFQKNIEVEMPFYNDLKLIQIVLLNIIDNCMKYTNPEKKLSIIHIEISDYKSGVKINISDEGVGIPQEIQSRIFDMFFRGTDQSKGSGLGLYLVNKIVNKLNGTIKVQSEYMKGTTMEVYIPTLPPQEPEENAQLWNNKIIE